MCGIFGCVLKDGFAAPLIHMGLKRLEYRGYDSVGIATTHDGVVRVRKDRACAKRVMRDPFVERDEMLDIEGIKLVKSTEEATKDASLMIIATDHK